MHSSTFFKWLTASVILCIITASVRSQSIPDSISKKIDGLFSAWNNHTPGCAVGIVKDDTLIFAKGYGMANLEYAVPITQQTIFHMASVSKQFAAYSIVLLASQGRLKLEDDVRKYLPWFPDLQEKITIRHILNHTSGIRDQWQLLAIAGTRLDDVITQEHIIKILSRQQALNFPTGEKYYYSNSGYTMAAEIVKSVTGKTLRQFADSAIFKPLGMTNTHFHDDYTEVVKNRAYSYQRKNLISFSNSILSYSTAGATSLFTNIEDLSKWVVNFYQPVSGTGSDINLLVKNGILNNGTEIDYALGILSNTYKGNRQYSHSGGDAGYRTYLTVFPELKMGFMVFSNLPEINVYEKAYQLADLFIRDTTAASPNPGVDSARAVLKDTTHIKKMTGDYVSDEGALFSFTIKNSKLYWQRYGNSDLLYPVGKDSFAVVNAPDVRFSFVRKGNQHIAHQYWPGAERILEQAATNTDIRPDAYTGLYHSPELDCKYGITLENGELVLTNNKYPNSKIKRVGNDHLFTDLWWMRHLKIITDSNNTVTGFEVNDGRVMHLRFNKIQ